MSKQFYNVVRYFPFDEPEVEETFDTLEEAKTYQKKAQDDENNIGMGIKSKFIIEEVRSVK